MKRRKNKAMTVLFWIGYSLIILAALALVGIGIWANIRYANTPVGEIPLWAVWLIFG